MHGKHPPDVIVRTPTFGDFHYRNWWVPPRIGERICVNGADEWLVKDVVHHPSKHEVHVIVERICS
jgi:hypothetical protein